MKNMKWAVLVVVGTAMGFAGGVYAAAAKKEMAVTPAADVKFVPLDPKQPEGPQLAVMFGDIAKKGPLGFLAKFPAGASPGMHSHSSDYYAVTIKGVEHNFTSDNEGPGLPPGSHWFQPAKQMHNNKCEAGSECIVFIYMPNGFDFKPAPAAKPAAGGDMKGGDMKPAAGGDMKGGEMKPEMKDKPAK